MLDLKFLRANPDVVKRGAEKKRIACDVDAVLALDARRRELTPPVDELRNRQKTAGKTIAAAAPEERAKLVEEQKTLKEELKALEEQLAAVGRELDEALLTLPNPPADGVPDGADEADNVELRRVGEPTAFDFEPRDHVEIGDSQGWLDIEAAGRLAGSRNYVLKGDLALLENAVMRFALDHIVAKGFTPVSVPMLVRKDALLGTGFLPWGAEQIYATDERDDLYVVTLDGRSGRARLLPEEEAQELLEGLRR